MQFHFCFAVFERVSGALGLVRKPALLAERNKTHAEFVGDGGAKEKATCVDADDFIDRFALALLVKMIPGLGKSGTSRTAARSLSIVSETMAGG